MSYSWKRDISDFLSSYGIEIVFFYDGTYVEENKLFLNEIDETEMTGVYLLKWNNFVIGLNKRLKPEGAKKVREMLCFLSKNNENSEVLNKNTEIMDKREWEFFLKKKEEELKSTSVNYIGLHKKVTEILIRNNYPTAFEIVEKMSKGTKSNKYSLDVPGISFSWSERIFQGLKQRNLLPDFVTKDLWG